MPKFTIKEKWTAFTITLSTRPSGRDGSTVTTRPNGRGGSKELGRFLCRLLLSIRLLDTQTCRMQMLKDRCNANKCNLQEEFQILSSSSESAFPKRTKPLLIKILKKPHSKGSEDLQG